MVYYFVIGEDGNRYGPADIDTLVQWTREGRLTAETILIERGTERQTTAGSLTAIAAELRRQGGPPAAVTIERDDAGPGAEAPTLTQPGSPASPQIPTLPGVPPPLPPVMGYAKPQVSSRSKIAAGLLGIFLGGLGVHRFYLGYHGIGLLMLCLSLGSGLLSLGCLPGAGCGIVGLWGFIEGIVCLAGGMRDADGLELRD